MAQGSRTVANVLTIMRVAISRRNSNDPDSNDATLLTYLNNFVSLSMSNDVRLFEQFGTLTFNIDETVTSGVYTFNDVGITTGDFVSVSNEAYISLLAPAGSSLSWNQLEIYRDPGQFFSTWGINNDDILIAGYPTEVLFYGNEFTFRTIPDTDYMIKMYGYKKNNDFSTTAEDIQFDYWLRYLAYGAALDYVRDYNYSNDKIALIQSTFSRERNLMLTKTHNDIKLKRSLPRF